MKDLTELSVSSLYRRKRKYDLSKPLTDKEQTEVIHINVELALRQEKDK